MKMIDQQFLRTLYEMFVQRRELVETALGDHVYLVLVAMVLGIIIAVPLGMGTQGDVFAVSLCPFDDGAGHPK